MSLFAQFYIQDPADPRLVTQLTGPYGKHKLDGRSSMRTADSEAETQAHYLHGGRIKIVGYKIMQQERGREPVAVGGFRRTEYGRKLKEQQDIETAKRLAGERRANPANDAGYTAKPLVKSLTRNVYGVFPLHRTALGDIAVANNATVVKVFEGPRAFVESEAYAKKLNSMRKNPGTTRPHSRLRVALVKTASGWKGVVANPGVRPHLTSDPEKVVVFPNAEEALLAAAKAALGLPAKAVHWEMAAEEMGRGARKNPDEPGSALLHQYLETIHPAIRRAKIRSSLLRLQGINRVYKPRYEQAEMLARKEYLQIDPERERVTVSREGNFFTYGDLTKTLVDYLEWLVWGRHQ